MKNVKSRLWSFLASIPFPSASLRHMSGAKGILGRLIGNLHWWQILLITVGIIAIVAIILALFFTFGDSTKYEWSTEIHPVDSEEFIQAISRISNSPIDQGGDVKILNNGDEFMPALLQAIKGAQKTIDFTAYIWEKGEMSDQLTPALLERARAGVEVRILLDGFGGHKAPSDKFDELKKAGVRVETFPGAKFGKLTKFDRRTHRRAMVIDGQTAFTGGMAIADHWLGHAQDKNHWRDNMFEVTGTMAQSLQSAFAQLWSGTSGEILEGEKFYPTLPKATGTPPSRYVNLLSSPASDTQPLPKFFWLSIASAQKSVYINSSYFVPDGHVRDALMERARAGVDVRILVPNNNTDAKPIRQAGHYYYEDLLKAGVKIYEYQPTMIHSKIMVIDSKWSVIGSANMDIRSVLLNEENVMGILNPKLAKDLESVFNENLKKSEKIDLAKWQKRNFLLRIMESVFVRFAKQY